MRRGDVSDGPDSRAWVMRVNRARFIYLVGWRLPLSS